MTLLKYSVKPPQVNKPIEEATDHFWRALFSYDKSNLEQANSTSLSFDWHPSQMLLIADIDAN